MNRANALGVLLHDLGGEPDEHADRERATERPAGALGSRQLLDHLGDGHAIALTDEVQQAERVVLDDGARTLHGLVALPVLVAVRRRLVLDGFGGFVRPPLDYVSGDVLRSTMAALKNRSTPTIIEPCARVRLSLCVHEGQVRGDGSRQ